MMSRPSPDSTRQQAVEIIGNCVYHALGLKESLEDERRALEQQDMTALHAAVESKSMCVRQLQTLDQAREELCTTAGFLDSPEQMQLLTEWCDDDSVLANCWQHLLDIAVECTALNITNGAIIHGRKQQIERSLLIIRGGSGESETYSRAGKEPSGLSQRSLAEA